MIERGCGRRPATLDRARLWEEASDARKGAAPTWIEGRRQPPRRWAGLGKVAVAPLGRSWRHPEKAATPIRGQGWHCLSGPVGGGDQAEQLGAMGQGGGTLGGMEAVRWEAGSCGSWGGAAAVARFRRAATVVA